MAAQMTFCVSPGRCGTGYLAKVLRADGVSIVHEPDPRFSEVGEEAQFDPSVARAFWDRKMAAIDGARYVETSHVVANGFDEVLLGMDVDAGLVAITRNHRDVALSLWRRGSIPGRTRRGRKFLRHPDARSLRPLPRRAGRWSDYQLCYWHCLEIEARQRWLEQMCASQGRPFYRTTFDALLTREGIESLVDRLNLNINWKHYESHRDWRVNANPAGYYTKHPGKDIDQQERAVIAAVGV